MAIISAFYDSGRYLFDYRFGENGQIFNNITKLWEDFTPSNWGQYSIQINEWPQSQFYSGIIPPESMNILATDAVYEAINGTPDITTDRRVGFGQAQGVNLVTINGDILSPKNLALSAASMVTGKAIAGSLSTTQMSTNLTATLNNLFNGRTIIWTSGVLAGAAATITSYDGTLKKIGFTAVPIAPSVNDTFVIV